MSIETWNEIYYPISAASVDDEHWAVHHSLQKWKGLTQEALGQHGLRRSSHAVCAEDGSMFYAAATSCALCNLNDECDTCPIMRASGDSCDSQYDKWRYCGDAAPMIELLTQTLTFVENERLTSGT